MICLIIHVRLLDLAILEISRRSRRVRDLIKSLSHSLFQKSEDLKSVFVKFEHGKRNVSLFREIMEATGQGIVA